MSMKFGNWAVVQQLGEGHFGAVYKVRRPVLNDPDNFQWGALKVLHPGSDSLREQTMTNEIIKISQLSHPGLSEFIESGEERDGNRWFVMRFIEGEDLESWLEHHGPLDEREWKNFTKQLLSVLSYTRSQNLSHLDIKPDNIVRENSGKYVLVDFGLSSRAFGDRINMHNNGWSAPEQFNSEFIESPATDVFSAALSIYFARTGKHAWGTANPFEYPTNVQNLPPNLSGLPQPLQLWLQPAFAKDPRNRPSAQKLLDELGGKVAHVEPDENGLLNPKTWNEFEELVYTMLEGQIDFSLAVETSNFGTWIFETTSDIDEAALYLYSGDEPSRNLMPSQRKRLFDAGWRVDTMNSQRLTFELDEATVSNDFISSFIRETLSSGLAVSIENVSVSLRD